MAGYEPIETASLDELRTLQTERLQSTLRNAYANIDHYTRAFDAAGVHPDDVTSLDDLARLPFLVKDDLREAYPFGMFAVPREDLVRVHASSGTTGGVRPSTASSTRRSSPIRAPPITSAVRLDTSSFPEKIRTRSANTAMSINSRTSP